MVVISQVPPAMTFLVLTDDQLAAMEERIVERVSAIIADHWLPRKPLSKAAAAEFFGVHERTINTWVAEGVLRRWCHNQTVLFTPDAIADFIAYGYQEAKA